MPCSPGRCEGDCVGLARRGLLSPPLQPPPRIRPEAHASLELDLPRPDGSRPVHSTQLTERRLPRGLRGSHAGTRLRASLALMGHGCPSPGSLLSPGPRLSLVGHSSLALLSADTPSRDQQARPFQPAPQGHFRARRPALLTQRPRLRRWLTGAPAPGPSFRAPLPAERPPPGPERAARSAYWLARPPRGQSQASAVTSGRSDSPRLRPPRRGGAAEAEATFASPGRRPAGCKVPLAGQEAVGSGRRRPKA